jgi:hypothetical protein
MRLLILIACGLLAGCATAGRDGLAVCDGKHRRAANPNGSVLAPVAPTAAKAETPAVAPKAAEGRSCGS